MDNAAKQNIVDSIQRLLSNLGMTHAELVSQTEKNEVQASARSRLHDVFCANVKARRTLLGRTQEEVAKDLGISQPAYASIERGYRVPGLEVIEKVSASLEISPDKLLVENDEVALRYISRNIRHFRNGMSYGRLASIVGTHPSSLERIENEDHMPGTRLLARIAEALNVTADDLLSESPETPP